MSRAGEAAARTAGFVQRSARLDRLRARGPRYLVIAALSVTCALGLRSIFAPSGTATADAPAPSVDNAAYDFAQRFARAYLTYDVQRAGLRERLLAPLMPEDFEVAAGAVADRGSQEVLWTQVASNQEAIAGGRLVVVAAGVSTQEEPLYLAVPLDRVDGRISLTAYPSMVGPPLIGNGQLPERAEVEDRAVLAVARRAIANYLAGDVQDLAADLGAGVLVSPPSQALEVRSVDAVEWAAGEGSSAVLATVAAADQQGALWTLTYEIGIASERGRPVVSFIETVPTDP